MSQHLPSPVTFREDINGLRAWAVIAVLLFHFSLIGLPGGFAGVDVFFVISGYLMTAIIVSGHEKGRFSIWKFYMARVRRILPALIVLIAALLVVGWFWLPTYDYQKLGAQSAYGLSFLSNIYYWGTAGYFDSASHEKWLLHTWSLAVEAQFYVLYPLIVALVWRFWKGLKAITITLTLLFIVSLTVNLFVINLNPSSAFYLLPSRGWELAAGGLVYLIARQNWVSPSLKSNGFWLGWVLVIGSFAFIEESFAWPGYWAILPVLGTSLIILGQRESCLLTDNTTAQWLGDRSYSLYLWHWPLVVALYFTGLDTDWLWVAGAFVLSLVLAHLSYQLIEVPTRQYLTKSKLFKEILVIALALAVVAFSAISVRLFDFSDRQPNHTPQAHYLKSFYDFENSPRVKERNDNFLDECNFFDVKSFTAKHNTIPESCISPSSHSVFLWGDSHAQALSYGLRSLMSDQYPDVGYAQVASSGCRPHIGESANTTGEYKKACDRSNQYALEAMKKHKPKLVIIAQREEHEENKLVDIASQLLTYGVQNVLIVGPQPQWNIDLPRIIARKYWNHVGSKIDDDSFRHYLLDTNLFLENSISEKANERILFASPINELCDGGTNCTAILDKHMTPLVFDYGHLTKEGSVFVGRQVLDPYIKSIFKQK